ncbi:hypothetical protein DTO013E5_7306 [Penicillium roqueforti]|uniref:Domain of unknown function at the cortex 1 domain-containing protein n=1 Tax=Penicillium roqueforti (strain FM164) TaxID=1365484 RepID=W6Q9V5_PENRF|nr:uncharacterized protein LCP9604111_3066 [Penicillium roqueforti]CDM33438.1 Protein of unknown function DUF1769 [Penicillium roqueforti FM164]KAF9250862.1 hypothetical protein LCP9604111_3066 [Penicillium roqueforti]KAI1830928.1 hypothetical protein CBS147337_8285 [Penicillium roqueforti]KAI2681483.1 hypothetical protein CBS147355_2693 [Penicillium roqueforti]KAI2688871.1 hypothetical protein LCP963914a_1960 [Penicillium roqueforti]
MVSQDTNAHKFRLKVTAGADYDRKTHQLVPVNGETIRIENEHAIVSLCVRIKNYTGYPESSPSTSPYFDDPLHQKDLYSICFSIIFKEPVNGNNLYFGNDFDHPVRDFLPPGFNTALRIVKWTLDPGLDGDVYADKPYLYSPALASWDQFRIGDKVRKSDEVPKLDDEIIEEGAYSKDAASVRHKFNIPDTVEGRRKYFQDEANRKEFEFEPGRMYVADFGNPYLAFEDFSVRLPGFDLPIMKYVDEKNHELRYTLKDISTGRVYLTVLFSVVLRGTEDEQDHSKSEQRDDSLGKFDWEPEPSSGDVE